MSETTTEPHQETPPETAPEGVMEDIAALTALLDREIAAIGSGDLSGIAARLDEKSRLGARLEAQTVWIETTLGQGDAPASELRDSLAELSALIARDAAMLERMRETTASVARELERLRARHGLGGLYGASGHRNPKDTLSRASMDKSV
ncbi:hypothetical protein [Limimaricola litoreus]|uniref:FlgN protein n=1 Tax=Limimaricola litoreus TaxID=2955316 RepID=A0A9X2FRG9_9RHOB|nr:hypothetical protein [Limimaricola litoreus]MCP1169235.1 hypothetical protein [Limimaricola litoreus]